MLRGLGDAKVEFVVIGGVAAVAHGSPFQTNDLDICYRASPENLDRLAVLLKSWAAYPRSWESGLPFEMDSRTLKTTPILTLLTREGQLDLLDEVAGVGRYDSVFANSQTVTAFDLGFRVLSLRALLAAKRATGRPKDLAQLPALEALQALLDEKGAN
jgi:hypothetical protein